MGIEDVVIKSVEKLSIKDGDVLIVKLQLDHLPPHLATEQGQYIQKSCEESLAELGIKARVWIVGNEVELKVLTKEQIEEKLKQ